MKRIKSDRIVCGERIVEGYVYFENGKITEISQKDYPVDAEFDAMGLYVTPGFIDIHTHGGGGFPFEGSVDDIVDGCHFHLRHGTTSICPTISAAEFESMRQSVHNVSLAMRDERLKSNIIGAHLEGPYLSKQQTGAQGAHFITPPIAEDYEPLVRDYPGAVARWSYAPEHDEGQAFAKFLKQNGIVASAGHTNATYKDIKPALDEGCHLITHLYSCTSTVTRDHGFRSLGVIESAFLEDDMYVEIIADGKHLPPELIRMICKIKGSDRVALISDSLALAGTDVKQGRMQSTDFIIEDGICKLLDRSAFAGSIATDDRLISVMLNEATIPLTEAVKMMTEIPARIMGLTGKGRLAPDMDADIVLFDDDVCVKKVFVGGEEIL